MPISNICTHTCIWYIYRYIHYIVYIVYIYIYIHVYIYVYCIQYITSDYIILCIAHFAFTPQARIVIHICKCTHFRDLRIWIQQVNGASAVARAWQRSTPKRTSSRSVFQSLWSSFFFFKYIYIGFLKYMDINRIEQNPSTWLYTWNEDPQPSHMFFSYVSLFQLIASNTSMWYSNSGYISGSIIITII